MGGLGGSLSEVIHSLVNSLDNNKKELLIKCNCCDKEIKDKEIQWNPDIKAWEMCSTCLDISLEAAFSGQFRYDDDPEGELVVLDQDWDGETSLREFLMKGNDYE